MDYVLEKLRELRPNDELPDASATARQRDALFALFEEDSFVPRGETQSPGPDQMSSHHRRPGRRLLITCAAAAIFALVLVLSPITGRRSPSAAAAVLERVAVTAADLPAGAVPGPGQFLYVKILQGQTNSGGNTAMPGTTWRASWSETVQRWIAPNGSGREKDSVSPNVQFLSPKDKEEWETCCHNEGTPAGDSSDGLYPPGAMTFPDTAGFPTNPKLLYRAIAQRYEMTPRPTASSESTFELAGTVLQEDASPTIRAAIYRMIEQMPGIRDLGPMTDLLGRRGVGVGLTTGSGEEDELIFDPSSSAVLESRTVVVDAQSAAKASGYPLLSPLPRGTVMSYQVFVTTGVVGSLLSLPGGAIEPWAQNS
jgi:hypothetical protein